MRLSSNIQQDTPVTQEYSGKWIAWNEKRTKIIASGETLEDVMKEAAKSGEPNPSYENVPPLNGGFVGTQ